MTSFSDISLVKEAHYPVKDYYSFINLFQTQAKKFRDNVYLRYEVLSSEKEIEIKTLTYGQVDLISTNLACEFYEKLGKKSVISIFEDHSVYYLILLYTFYKLRIPVQMISSRNSPASVCSLLKQAGSDCLVYGVSFKHIRDAAINKNGDIECLPMPELNLQELSKAPLNPKSNQILDSHFTEEDLNKAVTIVHSSGTTNTPKIVIWSNQFLMYFIQIYLQTFYKRKQFEFIEDENDVLIGITPSCHMFGTYSNYHCILSGGSIYYFKDFPPTAKHVIKVMKRENITRLNAPPYFVNQILNSIQDTGDIPLLQKLKFLATGGAATPKKIDEFLLENKINVLNMFSMSESYNLFSSEVSPQRIDTNTYFFLQDAEKHAYLEPFDEDRYQLIVKGGSPFLATGIKTRENGDYPTKDLFSKSKIVSNGYNYKGRADDVLVMTNGEKTNPLPMEDIIKSNPLISNCTVIGEGQPCTAVLAELNFEIAKDYCLDEIMEKVHGTVKKANKDVPSHSVIIPDMIKIIPFSKHLVTSDKGTVSRKRSIAYFQTEVDTMYAKYSERKLIKRKLNHDVHPDNIREIIMKNVIRVLDPSKPLESNLSLFKQGLNSLLSIQLQNYLSEDISAVPQDFMYEYPTINRMIDYFTQASIVEKTNAMKKEFNYKDTTDILKKYLENAAKDIIPATVTNYADPNDDNEHVVLLTGATGSLGASILLELLKDPKIKTIYALIRDNKSIDLMGRLVESFRKRGYPVSELYKANRVQVLSMDLNQEFFGLSVSLYNKLRTETTMIVACAWLLDFNQPVSHYDSECIQGLYNMVKFANKEINPIHFHFISSVSATGAYGAYVPEEAMPNDPKVALPMGYGQSKFIVEQLLHYLVKQKNMPCYTHRVGQLCGDSDTGTWNTSEMYPLILVVGGKYMRKMPSLSIELNWLPVNYASRAIIDIMMGTATSFPESINETVFHIVNTNEITWPMLLESLKKCGIEFEVVDPESWVREVSKDQNNPCYKLLGFFKKLFTSNGPTKRFIRWETTKTCSLSPNMKLAPTVKDGLPNYLKYWKDIGFYDNQ